MSTQYPAFTDGGVTIETDCKQKLEITIGHGHSGSSYFDEETRTVYYASERLTEDQIVDIAVGILGPAFYFTDSEDALARKFLGVIEKRGYTFAFSRPLDNIKQCVKRLSAACRRGTFGTAVFIIAEELVKIRKELR